MINQQEGILAKVVNGTYLLGDIIAYRHEIITNLEIVKI